MCTSVRVCVWFDEKFFQILEAEKLKKYRYRLVSHVTPTCCSALPLPPLLLLLLLLPLLPLFQQQQQQHLPPLPQLLLERHHRLILLPLSWH